LALTAFDDEVQGAIANVTIGTNLRQRQNVGAVRARGVETSAGLRLGAVSLDGSLAVTDAVVRSKSTAPALDGKRPAQTPKISASATLGWHPDGRFDAALTLRHTGRQFEDDLQTDALAAATTLGAFVQVPVSPHLSVVVRGENLTGERVVTRNQAGSIDLGAPRTVWIGVRAGL
jgi:outer membrane receptor protein involved in Fe transport